MLKTSFIGSHNNISIKISYGILEKKLEFMISIEFSSILMSLEGCFLPGFNLPLPIMCVFSLVCVQDTRNIYYIHVGVGDLMVT